MNEALIGFTFPFLPDPARSAGQSTSNRLGNVKEGEQSRAPIDPRVAEQRPEFLYRCGKRTLGAHADNRHPLSPCGNLRGESSRRAAWRLGHIGNRYGRFPP